MRSEAPPPRLAVSERRMIIIIIIIIIILEASAQTGRVQTPSVAEWSRDRDHEQLVGLGPA
jgi:hypothetical protein